MTFTRSGEWILEETDNLEYPQESQKITFPLDEYHTIVFKFLLSKTYHLGIFRYEIKSDMDVEIIGEFKVNTYCLHKDEFSILANTPVNRSIYVVDRIFQNSRMILHWKFSFKPVIKTEIPIQIHDFNLGKTMFEQKKFTDFLICSKTKQFPVHKAVMSASSEVFERMLSGNNIETKTNELMITDLTDKSIELGIQFMYIPSIDKKWGLTDVLELYPFLDKYDLKNKDCIVNFLLDKIVDETVMDIGNFVSTYMTLQNVYDECLEYVKNVKAETLKNDGSQFYQTALTLCKKT